MSYNCTTAFQPEQQRETLSLKEINKKKEKKDNSSSFLKSGAEGLGLQAEYQSIIQVRGDENFNKDRLSKEYYHLAGRGGSRL